MSEGTKVLLFGKTPGTVVGVSSSGKRVHVQKSDGSSTWTHVANAKAA